MLRPWRHIALLALVTVAGVPLPVTGQTFSDLHALRAFDFVENTEFHGLVLDDQHKLLVRQENNVATIMLRKWNRPPGGPFLWVDEDTGEDVSIIRFEDNVDLFRIRCEVLTPASPNYLQNPGQYYRVQINGIKVAPDYARVFEANAGDVLALLMAEIEQMYNDTHGIYRPAVYWGGMIALRVLNQSRFLPPDLATGTVRSRSFQQRIEGDHLDRRTQPRLQRFPKRDGMQEFASVLGSEMTEGMPTGQTWGTARNPVPTALEGAPVQPRAHQSRQVRKRQDARDHRERQTQNLTDQKSEQNPLGRPGRSLTTPIQEFPAISAAQMQSMDLLMGGAAPNTATGARIQRPAPPATDIQRPKHAR